MGWCDNSKVAQLQSPSLIISVPRVFTEGLGADIKAEGRAGAAESSQLTASQGLQPPKAGLWWKSRRAHSPLTGILVQENSPTV